MNATVRRQTKSDWVSRYAGRVFNEWKKWQTPLGDVDEKYIEHIKKELNNQFDDPLKRSMIESTYPEN